ncbi:transposase [Streptococcus thoraltensis]
MNEPNLYLNTRFYYIISGIAETTATSIIGEFWDIRRFQSANQINSFISINLRHYESGNFLFGYHNEKMEEYTMQEPLKIIKQQAATATIAYLTSELSSFDPSVL